jgi:hypothetical protein
MSYPIYINFLAVPSSSTDPVTAFDVSHSRGTLSSGSPCLFLSHQANTHTHTHTLDFVISSAFFLTVALVTGTATGKILAWHIPHVVSNLAPHLTAAAAAATADRSAPPYRFDCSRPYCSWAAPEPSDILAAPLPSVSEGPSAGGPTAGAPGSELQQQPQAPTRSGFAATATRALTSYMMPALYASSASSTGFTSGSAFGQQQEQQQVLVAPPPPPVPLPPSHYPCRIVAAHADEGIRGVCIVSSGADIPSKSVIAPGSVLAVIGDRSVKVLPALTAPSCLNMRFSRPHSDRLCADTITLHHKHAAALLTPADPLSCVVLDAFQQKQFVLQQLHIPPHATPCHFDGQTLGWRLTHQGGARVFTVASLLTQAPVSFTAFAAHERATFAIVSHMPPPLLDDPAAGGAAAVAAGAGGLASAPVSASSLGEGSCVVAVVGAATITVRSLIPFSEVESIRRDMGDAAVAGPDAPEPFTAPDDAMSLIGPDREVWPFASAAYINAVCARADAGERYRFLAHDQGVILAVLAENGGDDVVTLGSEGKLKLWHRGRLVAKFAELAGTFHRNYPVLLRRRGQAIYYTSDEGIYAVHLPFPAVGNRGELRLGLAFPPGAFPPPEAKEGESGQRSGLHRLPGRGADGPTKV